MRRVLRKKSSFKSSSLRKDQQEGSKEILSSQTGNRDGDKTLPPAPHLSESFPRQGTEKEEVDGPCVGLPLRSSSGRPLASARQASSWRFPAGSEVLLQGSGLWAPGGTTQGTADTRGCPGHSHCASWPGAWLRLGQRPGSCRSDPQAGPHHLCQNPALAWSGRWGGELVGQQWKQSKGLQLGISRESGSHG